MSSLSDARFELPEPLERARKWGVEQWGKARRRWDDAPNKGRTLAAVAGGTFGVAALVGVTGLADEVLAFTGETVFRVGDMPAIGDPDERTTVYDRNGEVIGVLTGPENRVSVPIEELPEHVVAAVIATEDQDFYDHEGVSVSGIMRAAVRNVLSMEVEQGGSTITQQYVKNALLTSERSLSRKITEATWAVRLEQRESKEQILQRYLDIIYLGDGTYGIGAASQHWFNKDARELSVADAALLAGMIRAPEATNPRDEPEAAQARRDVVLDQMVDVGSITAEEAEQAKQVDVPSQLDVTPLQTGEVDNGHLLEFVKQTLLADEELGDTRDERSALLFGGGLTINTTLDLGLVKAAEATLAEHLTDPVEDPMGGLVSIEPATGAVVSMAIGPKGFGPCTSDEGCTTTTVNPLVPGQGSPGRQVGSAFKPIVAAAALADGVSTDWHTFVDSGQSIPGCGNYRPENYDGSAGVRDMPGAMAESNNVFHVKLGVFTGLEEVVDLAGDLGIRNELEPQCSLSLGSAEIHPIDMASAYATFANGGVRCEVRVVEEILDREGKPFGDFDPDCDRVLDEDVAATVTTMLRGVVEGGTASRARIQHPVAAKTGTTNDNLDAWLVGYTAELATASWVGYEVPKPMQGILGYRSISGGTLPAVLWAEYMSTALDGVDSAGLPRVKLARYSIPECPPPPAPAPAPAPTDGPTVEPDGPTATAAPQAMREAPAEQGSDEELSRYNAQDGTYDTGTDGDSFEEGVQPERCEAVAPPEAYDRDPQPEPSETPTASESPGGPSEPSEEPSSDPAGEPSPTPTTQPTSEPTPRPTSEPTQEPAPTPTDSEGGGDPPS